MLNVTESWCAAAGVMMVSLCSSVQDWVSQSSVVTSQRWTFCRACGEMRQPTCEQPILFCGPNLASLSSFLALLQAPGVSFVHYFSQLCSAWASLLRPFVVKTHFPQSPKLSSKLEATFLVLFFSVPARNLCLGQGRGKLFSHLQQIFLNSVAKSMISNRE